METKVSEWTRKYGARTRNILDDGGFEFEPDSRIQDVSSRRVVRGSRGRRRRRRRKRIHYKRDPELKSFNLCRMINKKTLSDNLSDRWKALESIVIKLPESPMHRAKVYETLNGMLDVAMEHEMNRMALHRGQYDDERVRSSALFVNIRHGVEEMEEELVWTKEEASSTRISIKNLFEVYLDFYWDNRDIMRSSSVARANSSNGTNVRQAMLPGEDEIQPLWLILIRLHAFGVIDRWFECKTAGRHLKHLYKLIATGSDGGCLVDTSTPILEYPLSTLFKAIESLYAGWRELQYSGDLETYVDLLFSRYAIFSISTFTDQSKLDRDDMVDVEELTPEEHFEQESLRKQLEENATGGTRVNSRKGIFEEEEEDSDGEIDVVALEAQGRYRINSVFLDDGEAVLGSIKRELVTHNMLISLTEGKYTPITLEESNVAQIEPLMAAFKRWATDYIDAVRSSSIVDQFRSNLPGQLVRPGERERFQKRYPFRDPNDTNVVSYLRPRDIERYRNKLMQAAPADIINGIEDFEGMHTGRNEFAFAIIRYYTEEQLESSRMDGLFIRRNGLTNPEDVASLGDTPLPPVILQTLGCYMVWCPWNNSAVSVHNFPIAAYVCCKRYLEDFDSIIWPKWAYIQEDDNGDSEGNVVTKDKERNLRDDEGTQKVLIEWKNDRIKMMKDVFNVDWEALQSIGRL